VFQNWKKSFTNINLSEFLRGRQEILEVIHSMKLYYPDSTVTARQHFSVRVVQLRNKLPEETASVGSINACISRPNSMQNV